MRRVVRSHVTTALRRQQTDLERFIAERLEYPDAFPLDLAEPAVTIREVRWLKIAPRLGGDFPDVNATVALCVAMTGTAEKREPARGVRTAAVPNEYLGNHTFAIDVELSAIGMPAGRGYEIRPLKARLTEWWGRG